MLETLAERVDFGQQVRARLLAEAGVVQSEPLRAEAPHELRLEAFSGSVRLGRAEPLVDAQPLLP
ncbi:MAG: hypothetical protein AAF368_04680 [Planctomycetota bacterium]